MLRYHMQGYSGYGVQYSPFFDNKLAVASGSNFGLVGNGKLFILDIDNQGRMLETKAYLTQDGLFDIAWNELHENQVLVAQGDGSLRLFDILLNDYPIAIFQEHDKEVLSCNWNLINKHLFVSSSWDGTVKVWSPVRQSSITTLTPKPKNMQNALLPSKDIPMSNQQQHNSLSKNKNCIYQAQFSPHDPNSIMSCSGNSYVTLFDLRQPLNSNQYSFMAHSGMETLTCDYNKYRPHIVATGGVDNMIKVWDLRMVRKMSTNSRQPMSVNEISGHDLAVRKVSWSPHHSDMLLSTSYDMTCKVWQDLSVDGRRPTGKTNSVDPAKGCRFMFPHHTEFVFGADWSLWGQPGYIASTAWDGDVCVWYAFGR
ncbi:LANO_0C07624g1_1 [Lachancea nothofagi CBS 11611]|uniref:Peroxin-7 n=1 Tax=Lachancea nothofagi CBS 11611 TaxID=1266666 RepID=A0A1G4J9D5_9SACH|nr:LANO_0C07624g1_1 [Lachancea nothofagi CBS 11611]